MPDASPLGPIYRWLAFASTLVLVASMFLGFLGLVVVPFGALAAFVSLLTGMRWLDRQPQLRAVPIRDFVLLVLAAAGTFGGSLAVLLTPDVYPIYWAGLGLLILNAVVFVRRRARGVWIGAAVFFVFFVVAVLSVRSRGLIRAVETSSPSHTRLFLWFGADARRPLVAPRAPARLTQLGCCSAAAPTRTSRIATGAAPSTPHARRVTPTWSAS